MAFTTKAPTASISGVRREAASGAARVPAAGRRTMAPVVAPAPSMAASTTARAATKPSTGRRAAAGVTAAAIPDGAKLSDRKLRVAVIGGGPSGACAAETLAEGGVETFLFERKMDNCKGGRSHLAGRSQRAPARLPKQRVVSANTRCARGRRATAAIVGGGLVGVESGRCRGRYEGHAMRRIALHTGAADRSPSSPLAPPRSPGLRRARRCSTRMTRACEAKSWIISACRRCVTIRLSTTSATVANPALRPD
eukprot:363965-Chlamydomonas_euryale.AAC.7